jgi:hypothetical protein
VTTSRATSGDASLAASFLIEVLDLGNDVELVAQELTLVDRDQVVTVFAAEFESSVGPAAFLVYVYRLAQTGDDGRKGSDRFREDQETLAAAARLDTPGPRAIGQVESDGHGLILATSPAVFRALRGIPDLPPGQPKPAMTPAAALKAREEQSQRLLRLLRSANRAAETWLEAVDAAEDQSRIPEETELSLYLNDEQSIRSLLLAVNRLLDPTGKPPP